jgi:hypothetical protein
MFLLVFAVVLAVYAFTTFPSIAGGDSGELVAEACHLGVAHPPGYPLFTVLSHAAMQVPIEGTTPGWRVNAMCCCCGALAAMFVALTVRRWTGNPSDLNK